MQAFLEKQNEDLLKIRFGDRVRQDVDGSVLKLGQDETFNMLLQSFLDFLFGVQIAVWVVDHRNTERNILKLLQL